MTRSTRREAIRLQADMVRAGIAPHQLRPYADPEDGWVVPLDQPDVQAEVTRFMRRVWNQADADADCPPRSS